MTLDEARRHEEHACDVWPKGEDHIGVIGEIRDGRVLVAGHPVCGDKWFDVSEVETNCEIRD